MEPARSERRCRAPRLGAPGLLRSCLRRGSSKHSLVRLPYQLPVFFSQNKPVTSNQPAVLFSQKKPVLMQNLHPTSSTQQAEQASFTREKIPRRASQFSLKINKRQSS
jgi:hypothetical protein